MTTFQALLIAAFAIIVVQIHRLSGLILNKLPPTTQGELASGQRKNRSAKRWEYLEIQPHWNKEEVRFDFHVNGEVDEQLTSRMLGRDANTFMNIVGSEGWELVTLLALDFKSKEEKEWLYYFKRQLRNDPVQG